MKLYCCCCCCCAIIIAWVFSLCILFAVFYSFFFWFSFGGFSMGNLVKTQWQLFHAFFFSLPLYLLSFLIISLDYCKGRETLQNLCEQIAGDALLYSLFKENAEPVKCPLKGTSNRTTLIELNKVDFWREACSVYSCSFIVARCTKWTNRLFYTMYWCYCVFLCASALFNQTIFRTLYIYIQSRAWWMQKPSFEYRKLYRR